MPWLENRKKELANGPQIRERAFGKALDPDKLDGPDRYEVNLVRKFERNLVIAVSIEGLVA